MKLKWHLKRENMPESKMYCNRKARMNGGTAHYTTSLLSFFLDHNPCKVCLRSYQKFQIESWEEEKSS